MLYIACSLNASVYGAQFNPAIPADWTWLSTDCCPGNRGNSFIHHYSAPYSEALRARLANPRKPAYSNDALADHCTIEGEYRAPAVWELTEEELLALLGAPSYRLRMLR